MEGQRHWYVIHTYSGYENKVKLNLESKVHSLGMEDMIFQVLVPMQDELETKDDQQKVVSRKVFPGYVLIEMIVDDRTWYAVRNTPGVTGFVGTGTKPIPLSPREVARILGKQSTGKKEASVEAPIRMKCPVELDQTVRIKAPGFNDMVGTVAEISDEQKMVKLQVPAGKATPAPPVGPALGQAGINIMAFVKDFNARTEKQAGLIIPVEITVFEDRSFTFITKTPPAAVLLKKAAGIDKASGEPNKNKVATIKRDKVKEIAETKMKDLNAADVEAAMRMVEGTARSMGIVVED